MKFLLNDSVIEENSLPSDLTALRYLREKRALVGTKEGCASGDCGACTLLIGALNDGKVEYSTINSCITPIQALSGKHIVSVEYLSAMNNELHPAQRAMVDSHGSQCGFCTPGFVVSLAGLYEQHQSKQEPIDRHAVCDAISGNLCRCTGYRPIIEAGLTMNRLPPVQVMSADATIQARLQTLQTTGPATSANYLQPTAVSELLTLKASLPDARLIAGGTDLMLENTQRFTDFATLIDVSQVAELKQLTVADGKLHIGAGVTYSALETFFTGQYPEFGKLLERIASRQIRNRGTIGGNVANASPIADLPPLLLAFDATIELINTQGVTRIVATSEFYTGYKQTVLNPDEIITGFIIDTATLADFHRFYKVSKRIEDDISSVMLAARFTLKDGVISTARLAFGGMAATPIRAVKAEAALLNKAFDSSTALDNAINALRQELTPMTDMRASATYRLDIACNLIKKAWLELNGETPLNLAGQLAAEGATHA